MEFNEKLQALRKQKSMTQEELAQALAVIGRQNNLTMEQLKEYYTPEFEEAVMNSVLTGKVMRLIRDAADIAEV